MASSESNELEQLTGGSTVYFGRITPLFMTVLGGAVTAAAWLDLLGDEPLPTMAKGLILAVWLVMCGVAFGYLWRFPRVWRDGDDLLIGDPQRGLRIPLSEVKEVRESRFRQMKIVTLELNRSTPLGRKIHFVPRGAGAFFFPLSWSPVAAELRDEVRARRRLEGR
ncbi:MAG: hypothetical protein PVJ02_05295 [Gemmatimonadota bacterium]|jgi:hypothetical protein